MRCHRDVGEKKYQASRIVSAGLNPLSVCCGRPSTGGCAVTDESASARCSEPHVFHVGIEIEAIARFLAEAAEAREVDPDQLPVALHDLARDEHGIDVL